MLVLVIAEQIVAGPAGLGRSEVRFTRFTKKMNKDLWLKKGPTLTLGVYASKRKRAEMS